MKKWTIRLALLAAALNVAVEAVRLRSALREEKEILRRAQEMAQSLVPPAQMMAEAVAPPLAVVADKLRATAKGMHRESVSRFNEATGETGGKA